MVLFKFFKKPMASKTNNRYQAGIPEGSKVATCTQEVLRRLKNTSRDLEDHHIEEILQEYFQELRESGYPQALREEILRSASKGYAKIWDLECSNRGHLNRPGTTS